MQPLLRALLATLALAYCAGAASHTAEGLAQRWLADHRQAPGADELSELKGANPEAYAIVKALMMKQSLGLLKSNNNNGRHSIPLPAFTATVPEPLDPPALPAPSVVAQGFPTDVEGSGPAPPEELPEIAAQTPTAPPPMPPPQPISPDLPPALDEPSAVDEPSGQESNPAPGPAPVPYAPELSYARLSAAATSSSVSTASVGGHSWMNWNPDQMIADNEKMVSNVLGAVAQLTGAHVHRATQDHQDGADSPLSQDEILPDAAPQQVSPLRRALGNAGITVYEATEPTVSRAEPVSETLPMRRDVARQAPRKAATKASQAPDSDNAYLASKFGYQSPAQEPVQTQHKILSPADEYLASEGTLPMESVHPREPSDDGIAGHLPGDVSWSNPYTFTASANVDAAPPRQENSYLREVDLGVPLARHKTPDDENPYLQMMGSTPHSAPTDVSASSLTAMHQDQLLSSHTILYEHDVEWMHDKKKQQLLAKTVKAKPKKDVLAGFLAPTQSEEPKSPPASLVNKNVYLARLGEATAATAVSYSGSSDLASNIEQGNPYLMALDDAPTLQQPVQAEPAAVQAPPAELPKKDVSHPQLSMASSNAMVHEKAVSKTVTQKRKVKVNLSGWLGGESSVKAPDPMAERLHWAVAQRVADNKNPYLQGLDIDAQKGQAAQDEDNPYMDSLD